MIDLGTVFLQIVALLQVPLALTMVLAGSLRGAGDTRFIMVATMIGMWAVRVPIAFVAGAWLQLGVFYVWLAMIADWTLRIGSDAHSYRSERWKAIQVLLTGRPGESLSLVEYSSAGGRVSLPEPTRTSMRPTPFTFAQRSPKPGVTRR
ncbi:MAG: MATE family efflux transporter [Nitrospiraceae bacterium]